jgi:hypothetical protein
MAWFQKKLTNTAAAPPLPPPETTVNHHYYNSRTGLIFSLFVVGVAAAALFWLALVFLAERAGARQPETDVARCLLGLFLICLLLVAFAAAGRFFLNDFYRHSQTMEQIRLQAVEKRARLAQSIAPHAAAGMAEENKRRYRAVVMAMARAYQMIDEAGKLRTRQEPWSKSGVGSLTIIGEPKPIGEDSNLAKWVKPYLLEKGVLLDDRTVDLARFPDVASVEALLVADLGRPIMLYRPGKNQAGMSGHYIEQGSGKESWG